MTSLHAYKESTVQNVNENSDAKRYFSTSFCESVNPNEFVAHRFKALYSSSAVSATSGVASSRFPFVMAFLSRLTWLYIDG
jgi:hypothetical protein